MPQPSDSSAKILLFAFIFSVLVHILFFITLPTGFYSQDSITDQPRKIIRVARIRPEQGQLVDITDQKHDTTEQVETNYLSDRNRKVEKQTRSLNITRQQNQSTNTKSKEQTVEKKSKYSLNLTDRTLRNLAEESGPTVMNQSMTSNYLPEITIGDETLLNTKEFAFNSFYIRMKHEIEGFWNPVQSANQNRSLHGRYITTIHVVLDSEGYLIQANIIKSSGFVPLDQEAVQAINKASPFPNPPKEVLGEDEKIRMNWSFIFDKTSFM